MNNKQTDNIVLPRSLFGSMLEVYQKWEKFSDEFEDFLASSDKQFIQKMRTARQEHLGRQINDIENLKQRLE